MKVNNEFIQMVKSLGVVFSTSDVMIKILYLENAII
jgi:hypothetical protein